MQSCDLVSTGGAVIAARFHEPPARPIGVVVIGGAMGVNQDYYAAFARWLADQGYLVASFDYRGMGDSRHGALRTLRADLFDWTDDFDTVIAEALRRSGDAPLYIVGHSLGAQLPGLLKHRDRIAGLVSVAAGSGYWRDNAPQLKRMVLYFWHVLVPIATTLFGYFPGRKLRKVGDLPAGVVLQWRRWCLNPRYHVGAEGAPVREKFEAVRFPLVALSMTDDELMTERGTHVLVDCYANAPRRVERIAPANVQAGRIGHFGFFRDQFQTSLWARALALLQGFQIPKETAA
ncbi:alpha/beta fold hydrolase [Piscinibacter sp.]|uniref:alpha/beta hydrolase family protein n=1 Tax=Piscinibacter sp. TaxID=1903157 RepID=UPI002C2B893F|nr:alpha/beta fold hydrolase [Albitalea sp.]HUG21781.1 alpha/beta fold hydrolase [Albitalea sp.]